MEGLIFWGEGVALRPLGLGAMVGAESFENGGMVEGSRDVKDEGCFMQWSEAREDANQRWGLQFCLILEGRKIEEVEFGRWIGSWAKLFKGRRE